MAKYTYADVIIDPDDPRIEIGKEYYRADSPKRVLCLANNDDYIGTLEEMIDTESTETPFVVKTGGSSSLWACLIRKKEPTYEERQAEWGKANNIKIGDKVMVTRTATYHENGWRNVWDPTEMDAAVNKVYEIVDIHDRNGIRLPLGKYDCWFPYFVLEKVEQKYVPFDFSDLDCRAFLLEKIVKAKNDKTTGPALIIGFTRLAGGEWIANLGGITAVNSEALFNDWVFIDGTPCGKLVEDEE